MFGGLGNFSPETGAENKTKGGCGDSCGKFISLLSGGINIEASLYVPYMVWDRRVWYIRRWQLKLKRVALLMLKWRKFIATRNVLDGFIGRCLADNKQKKKRMGGDSFQPIAKDDASTAKDLS